MERLAKNLLSNPVFGLLVRTGVSVIVGYDGKPRRSHGVTWSEPPELHCTRCPARGRRGPAGSRRLTRTRSGVVSPAWSAYCFPYLIGLLPRGIEVRTLDTQGIVQTIPLARPTLLTEGDVVYVATQNGVWRLHMLPLINQVDQLVEEKLFEEALNLLDLIKDMPHTQKVRAPCGKDRGCRTPRVHTRWAAPLARRVPGTEPKALCHPAALRLQPLPAQDVRAGHVALPRD